MRPDLQKRIEAIAGDRTSGASEILAEAIGILREAGSSGDGLEAVASALVAAQPSMAPLWNAAKAARAGDLEQFAQRVARGPTAIARFAAELLETGADRDRPIPVVTFSYSGTVAYALELLGRRRRLEVACAEGRPALEGQRLAARLAAAGIPVAFHTDAGIGTALSGAAAVVVGADAVTRSWFLNKVGTRMLAASAAQQGVPMYVLAGREKFVAVELAAQLAERSAPAAEVWLHPPAGIDPRNPYFERIPLELAAAIVTEIGVLAQDALI